MIQVYNKHPTAAVLHHHGASLPSLQPAQAGPGPHRGHHVLPPGSIHRLLIPEPIRDQPVPHAKTQPAEVQGGASP